MFRCVPTVFLALCFLCTALRAQNRFQRVTDSITTQIDNYSAANKDELLFVHFDKNIYTSNEAVWFTGYLLAAKQPGMHNTLAVSLVRQDDSAVLYTQKFVMADGFAYGNFNMPDSLQAGNYYLLAVTNVLVNEDPVARFVQPVTIKSTQEPKFTAMVKLAQKVLPGDDSATIQFKAFAKDIKVLASNTEVSYTLNNLRRTIKTNFSGDASFRVPVKNLTPASNLLRVRSRFNGDVKKVQLALPVNNGRPSVRFYPEGGSLVAHRGNTIGWEVLDMYGRPTQASLVLFNNGKAFDTVQCGGYGMGRFNITPGPADRYTAQLVRADGNIEFDLPAVTAQGISIAVNRGLCNDTLYFRAEDLQRNNYVGIIHNYNAHYLSFPIDLSVAPARNYHVPLDEVPRGLATLLILDSLGRPVAERLFFAHNNQRTEVQIKPGAETYATRDSIQLDIKLEDAAGQPVKGIVSVACVQDNRIDARKMTDIESYVFLNRELANLPFKKSPMGDDDEEGRNYREDVLLVKGWRRYTWTDLVRAKIPDTSVHYSDVSYKGEIVGLRSVKGIYEINTLAGKMFNSVKTDKQGKFQLARESLIVEPGNRVLLFIKESERPRVEYMLSVTDPYTQIAKKVSAGLSYENLEENTAERSSESLLLKKGEKAEMLQEVIVRSTKDNSFFGSKNRCGDYVCMYNILNCPNHPAGGTLPVKGMRYNSRSGYVVYAGCILDENPAIKEFKGIYTAREFYGPDYKNAAPTEEFFVSTIYWNHGVTVSADSVAHIGFRASDIPGKFRVVAQGVSTNGVVRGEAVFMVNKRESH